MRIMQRIPKKEDEDYLDRKVCIRCTRKYLNKPDLNYCGQCGTRLYPMAAFEVMEAIDLYRDEFLVELLNNPALLEVFAKTVHKIKNEAKAKK